MRHGKRQYIELDKQLGGASIKGQGGAASQEHSGNNRGGFLRASSLEYNHPQTLTLNTTPRPIFFRKRTETLDVLADRPKPEIDDTVKFYSCLTSDYSLQIAMPKARNKQALKWYIDFSFICRIRAQLTSVV